MKFKIELSLSPNTEISNTNIYTFNYCSSRKKTQSNHPSSTIPKRDYSHPSRHAPPAHLFLCGNHHTQFTRRGVIVSHSLAISGCGEGGDDNVLECVVGWQGFEEAYDGINVRVGGGDMGGE